MSVYSHMYRELDRLELMNQERKEFVQKKDRAEEDALLMSLQTSNKNETFYGVMKLTYQQYIVDHQILFCSKELTDVINYVKKIINFWIGNNISYDSDYMIYQVNDINPKLVSYKLIKSSGYPYVVLCYKPLSKNILQLYGNTKLSNDILDSYKELKDFFEFRNKIKISHYQELQQLCMKFGIRTGMLSSNKKLINQLTIKKFQSMAKLEKK